MHHHIKRSKNYLLEKHEQPILTYGCNFILEPLELFNYSGWEKVRPKQNLSLKQLNYL